MQILKNNKILVQNARFINPVKGLMFSRKLKNNQAVVLDVKNYSGAIHMLFVFFSIDVVWLDENYKVIDIKKNVKPFNLYVEPKSKPRYIIESNPNSFDFKIGDKLTFNQKKD
ncbi:DUF192 domain-containing protein [Candidatus Woesearchaeota archaeon]|nr:DUF192 domain-containing protein [Candidatus Woesearchaeota archaeon]